MKRYFYSGHVARREGGRVTFEFSGITEAANAVKAYNDAHSWQVKQLEKMGGDERSQYVVIDTFTVIEEF